ncbi:MAG: HAD family hydrolase [Caldisericia bacterium]
MHRYDAVLFDVDDTLLDFDASEEAACRHVFDYRTDSPATPFALFAAAFRSVHNATWDLYMAGTVGRADVFRVTFEELAAMGYLDGMDPAVAALTCQDWFVLHSVPEPEALRVLALLHTRYRTGVVSNYELADIQRKRLAASGLAELLDVVVISGDSGVEKPDPAIFDETLHQLGLGPSECLFVGDSLASDAAGALEAGMDFCWYRRHHTPPFAPTTAVNVIDSLTELPALLDAPDVPEW